MVLILSYDLSFAGDDTVTITAIEIEELQAHTMADILNTVPGLSAGSSSVSIHGNYKVKVFLDGRPLNDPTSSHGAIKWDLVSPVDVEKIEILRGKGGVRYGQDASGGVILITSKSGKTFSGNLKSFGGSQNRFFLRSGLQWEKGVQAGNLRAGYESSDGYQINNDKERYQAGATLTYGVTDTTRLSISGDFTEDDRGYAGYPDYPTPFSRAASTTRAYSLQCDMPNVQSKAYLNRGEKRNTDVSRGLDKTIAVDDYGFELDPTTQTKYWGKLSYGAGLYYSTAVGTSFTDQDESTTSVYLIDSCKLDSLPLSFSFGLRANFNSAFDDSFNPEGKLAYSTACCDATLSYNRTNNTPSFYQRYNETSTTRPNPDLGMEVADNFSLTLFSKVSKKLSGSLTLYYNLLSDRITYTYGINGTSSYQNVGSASYTGSDLSVTWLVTNDLKLKLNYTYLEAKDEDTGFDLPAKPHHKGRLDLTCTPMDRLSIILTGRGVSESYRNRTNTTGIAGYFIYDCKMEYSFEKVNLFLEVNNLLDEEYLYVDGVLAPPRAWFAGIQMRI